MKTKTAISALFLALVATASITALQDGVAHLKAGQYLDFIGVSSFSVQ